jgi:tetratricopeptide (TPR) repeat protein
MMRALLLATALAGSTAACAAQAQDPSTAYRTGRYEEAIAFYKRGVEAGTANAVRGLARVYLETGRYADAEALLAAPAQATAHAALLADALRLQGKTEAAVAAAQRGLTGPDSLNAKLRLALLAHDDGRSADALRSFDGFIDSYNAGRKLTPDELVSVGIAVKHVGVRDPQLFKDALRAFDEAIAADPGSHDARVQIGRLFLEKYNSAEARRAFTEVLRINPHHPEALAGLAEVLDFDNQPGAVDSARRALQANPGHVGVHAFLTHAFLMTDMLDSARVHAQAALATNAKSLDALMAAAALEQVTNNQAALRALTSQVRGAAAARMSVALAELSVQQRQYARAVQLAEAAIAQDSTAWLAYSVLGINQLRLGDAVAARRSLEKSFAGDPYNVWVKNSLDLLDRLDKFETRSSPHFRIVANTREADVLAPYVAALGEEAFAKLAARYGYTPPTPVRIELFDRHADFSVRTVGLAGLGALGVSFGSVLAMDAPSARKRGEFNWGSTFWHELAHAFHLGMTSHRVPRWFTEGLAVLEERRARPGWGEEGLPHFRRAVREKKLLPIGELNNGFVRPTYPAQVEVSYYQSSLVLELIEQKYGANALRDMLRGYAAGKATEGVFRDVLRTTPQALEREFGQFVDRRVADDARVRAAEAANDYDALIARGTAESLELAMYISPYDLNAHSRLAELYARSGNRAGAVRERQAIVALQPVDMAEARYQLALAHFEAGDTASARREVLRALENAPNFQKAQELLLKLTEARS